jgi:hypothetical protein
LSEQEITASGNPDTPGDRSVSLLAANFLMVFFALPAVLILGGVYAWIWGAHRFVWALQGNYLAHVVAVLAGIVAHEAIHGLTWKIVARKPAGAITFGMNWKLLTPYAHCREPMTTRAYRIGAVMPLLLLGLLPALVGIAGGQPAVMLFGLFFTFAAGGDMLILWLLRGVPATALVEDHAERAGCRVVGAAPATPPDTLV